MKAGIILLLCTLAVPIVWGTRCVNEGKLGERFLKNLNVNDQNNDRFTTGFEFYRDFKNNYDIDQDGCCTVQEWVNRWQSYFKFSREYAVKRLADIVPDMNATCTVAYDFYLNPPVVRLDVEHFLDGNIRSLIDLCNKNRMLMVTNCDCSQLLGACQYDKLMSAQPACQEYARNPIIG